MSFSSSLVCESHSSTFIRAFLRTLLCCLKWHLPLFFSPLQLSGSEEEPENLNPSFSRAYTTAHARTGDEYIKKNNKEGRRMYSASKNMETRDKIGWFLMNLMLVLIENPITFHISAHVSFTSIPIFHTITIQQITVDKEKSIETRSIFGGFLRF